MRCSGIHTDSKPSASALRATSPSTSGRAVEPQPTACNANFMAALYRARPAPPRARLSRRRLLASDSWPPRTPRAPGSAAWRSWRSWRPIGSAEHPGGLNEQAIPRRGWRAGPTISGGCRRASAASRRSAISAAISPETNHDAFLPLAIAAEHTTRLGLGTSVAIAFPRAPMVVAQVELGPPALLQGALLPRPRQPGAQAQRGALLASSGPRRWRACASTSRRCARSGTRGRHGTKPVVRRRALPLHVHDAVLQPRSARASAHSDRDRPRSIRRCAGSPASSATASACTTSAPAVAREMIIPNIAPAPPRRDAAPSDVELSGGGFIATGPDDRERAARGRVGAPPDLVLRLDAVVLRRARSAGLGRARRAAEQAVARRQVARDGARRPRRRACTPSPPSAATTRSCRSIRERFAGVARIAFPPPREDAREEGAGARAAAGADGES